jgi:sulfite reductase beta subunit-like hemoprotein
MTKAKFEIGETEKHTIIVNVTPLLKYTAIEVDGEKVVNESHFSSLPKKFQVEVTNTEKKLPCAKWKYLDLDTKNGGESND